MKFNLRKGFYLSFLIALCLFTVTNSFAHGTTPGESKKLDSRKAVAKRTVTKKTSVKKFVAKNVSRNRSVIKKASVKRSGLGTVSVKNKFGAKNSPKYRRTRLGRNAETGDENLAEESLNTAETIENEASVDMSGSMLAVYDSLHLDELGLNTRVFRMALKGMQKLKKMGRLTNDHILSIVDFSQPSVQKRLYVIDMENCVLLYNTLVAHGMKSGKETAKSFSNKVSSNKSSLGFYVTNNTYNGNNGYSLRLQGCEKGFNDNAAKRAIVVHGADYVNENWISSQGYIGRSQGCPALPPSLSQPLIDDIKDGTCLFIYSPNPTYLSKSKLVK
jgi:L,D-transpeptidase-like protein